MKGLITENSFTNLKERYKRTIDKLALKVYINDAERVLNLFMRGDVIEARDAYKSIFKTLDDTLKVLDVKRRNKKSWKNSLISKEAQEERREIIVDSQKLYFDVEYLRKVYKVMLEENYRSSQA